MSKLDDRLHLGGIGSWIAQTKDIISYKNYKYIELVLNINNIHYMHERIPVNMINVNQYQFPLSVYIDSEHIISGYVGFPSDTSMSLAYPSLTGWGTASVDVFGINQ